MPELRNYIQKASEWVDSMRRKPACGLASRAEFLLRAYHMKAGPEVQARSDMLNDIIAICTAYLKNNSIGSSHFADFTLLGMQASKQLTAIKKAGKAWTAAKKVFGGGRGPHGTSNSLVHYSFKESEPTRVNNYWLEGLDPKHRSWGHLGGTLFDDWNNDSTTNLNFYDWLESKNLGQDLKQVQYLSTEDRWKYMCVFGDDKIMYRHDLALGGRGKGEIPLLRFTTYDLETAHSGKNYAIWVCSPGGIFYTNTHKVSEFHHSSFLAGGRTLAAGEWVIAAGKLLLISHKTGHYAASPTNLYQALLLLDKRVDLSRTVVQLTDYSTKKHKFATAKDFLQYRGNVEQCNPILGKDGQPMDMKTEAQLRCEQHIDWDFKPSTDSSRKFKAA